MLCNFDAWLHKAAMFHKTCMIDDDDILQHISDASFQNLNQVLRTFDDPVEGAYTFNDSRYISLKSDSNNSINGGDPYFPQMILDTWR